MKYTNFHKNSPKETREKGAGVSSFALHVCDVIQFRDDHARMRINDPLVSLARLRGTEKNRVDLDVRMSHCKATFVNIATCFWT